MFLQSLIGAVILALIHLSASQFRFLDVIPRSRWLSIAGGVAVAYVLLHLFPEIANYTEIVRQAMVDASYPFAADHVLWSLVLIGLVGFYGLEKAVGQAKQDPDKDHAKAFWLHVFSYAIYNALLGYLLVREDRGWVSLTLYLIGIGLHFVVNDHGLRQHHAARYQKVGRWILSSAILVGWGLGVATDIHEVWTGSLIALLSGGILLNTFKEELPDERESRYWAFAAGTLGYAGILLSI